jgi:hypothetical protein
MGILDGLIEGGTAYYAGKEGIGDAEAAGQAGLGVGQEIGTTAAGMAEFKPYTVTSNLVQSAATTPEGGLDLQLSPEEQARQNQYLGQAQSMFGGLSGDVAGGSQAIYEQMRAAQRPEEERQRMAMQQGLFSSGRGGISSAQFGGTPEQFAYEKARQEAMLNSQIAARTQFGQEQQNLLQSAQGLQTAGYNPQEQAIGLFGAANAPASYADAARRQQGSLYGQAASGGLESFMEAQKQANELRQIQMQGMLNSVSGHVNPITGERSAGMFDSLIDSGVDWLSNQSWNPFGNNYGVAEPIITNNPVLDQSSSNVDINYSAAINPLTGKPYEERGIF